MPNKPLQQKEIEEGFSLLGLSNDSDRARFTALGALACLGQAGYKLPGQDDPPQDPEEGDHHA